MVEGAKEKETKIFPHAWLDQYRRRAHWAEDTAHGGWKRAKFQGESETWEIFNFQFYTQGINKQKDAFWNSLSPPIKKSIFQWED